MIRCELMLIHLLLLLSDAVMVFFSLQMSFSAGELRIRPGVFTRGSLYFTCSVPTLALVRLSCAVFISKYINKLTVHSHMFSVGQMLLIPLRRVLFFLHVWRLCRAAGVFSTVQHGLYLTRWGDDRAPGLQAGSPPFLRLNNTDVITFLTGSVSFTTTKCSYVWPERP